MYRFSGSLPPGTALSSQTAIQPSSTMSRSSPSSRFEPLSEEEFSDNDVDSSPPQPRPRPLRGISPNTRAAYAARASARRAALRESHPVGRPTTPSPGLRASFADVVAGVAATAAPHPQISADARRSAVWHIFLLWSMVLAGIRCSASIVHVTLLIVFSLAMQEEWRCVFQQRSINTHTRTSCDSRQRLGCDAEN